MAALSIRVGRKTFAAVGSAPVRPVLDDVRLELAPGEIVALTGPSGCGKTTLLNIVAGLDRDFEGRIDRGAGTRIGYVFQEPRLLPWRTVVDNLRLVLPDVPSTERRIANGLAEVGLTGAAEVFASRLSLGMARRVALARAFIVEPDLLLLDEPFVSLDEPTALRLRFLLLDLLERHGTTALFVTHSLQEAVMIGSRIVALTSAPARVEADIPVDLDPAARRDASARALLLQRLLSEHGGLAELRPDAITEFPA